MNSNFIRLKNMEGELKFTQMNNNLGCTVTSKELIFFKPHMTYHLFLHDIVSMVPVTLGAAPISFRQQSETIQASFGSDYYKLNVKWGRVISRSGIVEKENMEFIVPLSAKVLSYISQYSGLVVIR
ncbi:hypothetical protein BRE01_28480 [Brevibacillus reuszeri]|uniref:Uncharacterized protein n=1 Tax=Brevibacillus reuszeri TaxID=54915 RepID=A0A0K9YIZ6_9BACL|nr:hypothetical protein [Brevibacillus reuszeri]KNB68644.1 hypothetical protein ADS79_32250 [Brevibacillus reuszeri]MED1858933.1 hypothetical protein [Brevibacillus reuszeri]GED69146.1 hypothetical protein BRE01_28480 [Brevibacillus reuszeri]